MELLDNLITGVLDKVDSMNESTRIIRSIISPSGLCVRIVEAGVRS